MAANNQKASKAAGVGLGLAALAATAAGAYFLYGKDGAKNRKKIKGWVLTMKGEVLSRIEGMREFNEEAYKKIVDDVTKRYKAVKNVDKSELLEIAADLKKHWGTLSKQVSKVAGGAKKRVTRATK